MGPLAPLARLFGGASASSSSSSSPPPPKAPHPGDRAVLQVGGAAFDATVALRVELWLSVLHRAGGAGARAGRSYAALLERGPADEATADLIAKDATRTFPTLPRRAFDPAALARVLRAYAASDPEVGYMQGEGGERERWGGGGKGGGAVFFNAVHQPPHTHPV
jgi:hypothetical protein